MRCDGSRAVAGLAIALLGLVARAHAETPTLLAASALYESPTLVSPAAIARFTLDSNDEWRIAQLGWTSSVDYLHPVNPDLAFVAGGSFTPWFAHASNLIYRDDQRVQRADFGDTSAQISAGLHLRHGDWVFTDWRALLLKEWLFDIGAASALDAEQAAFWRDPYAGAQASFGVASVRSEEPFKNRVDGVRAQLDVQAFAGAEGWARGRLAISAGRKIDRVFLRASAVGFAISTDNLVARELIGGQWDVLQGIALYGHPYAALRAQHGLAANAGVDVELWHGVELGARAGAFGEHTRAKIAAHGEAVLAMVQVAGALLIAGVSTPDADAFQGRFDTLRAFAAVSAAMLTP
jgi:hypothetical protein